MSDHTNPTATNSQCWAPRLITDSVSNSTDIDCVAKFLQGKRELDDFTIPFRLRLTNAIIQANHLKEEIYETWTTLGAKQEIKNLEQKYESLMKRIKFLKAHEVSYARHLRKCLYLMEEQKRLAEDVGWECLGGEAEMQKQYKRYSLVETCEGLFAEYRDTVENVEVWWKVLFEAS